MAQVRFSLGLGKVILAVCLFTAAVYLVFLYNFLNLNWILGERGGVAPKHLVPRAKKSITEVKSRVMDIVTPEATPVEEPLERRANACFVVLVRNEELIDMVTTVLSLEKKFNSKYKYSYVFLNDKPFTEMFKNTIRLMTKSNVTFGLVPKEHWSYPSWINQTLAAETRENMRNIIYGDSESYRHMCRYQSGFFFRHPLLESYEYYWRVEPGVKFLCDIDYDPFLYLKDNDLQYGFTISLTEIMETVPTLWSTTKEFMRKHPEYVNNRNMLSWVTDRSFQEYNGCHFWSNFEIASFQWLRSEKYLAYFDYLDQAGGYFYERWGDAPVHSLALSMFLPPEQVHWFSDIGYFHSPFTNCPIDPVVNLKKCQCDPDTSLYFSGQSCTKEFLLVDRKPTISLHDAKPLVVVDRKPENSLDSVKE
ncbi:alpha-1,2-mannosyltransferase ktr1 [Dispira simplex]|nr:alpha-1,2-mannosyltransferase ktr1 [Dispira simplex]